jgi:hypothetical protein
MAGQSDVSNTFDHIVDENFDFSVHTNENTGGGPPNIDDHTHFLFQDNIFAFLSGTQSFDTLFDNGITFNTVTNQVLADGTREVLHVNNHVDDFLLV